MATGIPDDAIVFGIVEGDEALAIPKNIAEIHEMFNLTLGERRFGIPYCTLCGAAQAYRTDDAVTVGGADEVPVLRTSGLLSRSNKVMYDLRTQSVFDTFTGAAVSGPLQDQGIVLEETTVLRTTWGEWKAEHPDTTIIAEDGGIGRSYPLDPLQGRDDNGPIFPIGPADDRLPEQELVVGVITADGTPVAFPAAEARAILSVGDAGGRRRCRARRRRRRSACCRRGDRRADPLTRGVLVRLEPVPPGHRTLAGVTFGV